MNIKIKKRHSGFFLEFNIIIKRNNGIPDSSVQNRVACTNTITGWVTVVGLAARCVGAWGWWLMMMMVMVVGGGGESWCVSLCVHRPVNCRPLCLPTRSKPPWQVDPALRATRSPETELP